ncbi:MAG: stage II sporulation protein M [Chloroflexi bacterium]|nr:stage II sporulation protein M [Chloroflexota bacterium]
MVERFVSRRKSDWDRLEKLVSLGKGKRIGALSAEEIVEMGYLYRRAVADLAVARRDFPAERVAMYLNQLVARAHAAVYRAEAGEWRAIVAFFTQGFPLIFRETLAFTGAAFLVFTLAAAAGFSAVLLVPDSATYLVPEPLAASIRERRMWTEEVGLPAQLMASVIMTNNIQVTLLAFAGGVLFGVATFYVLLVNGLMLGSIAGMCQVYGLSLRLWSFVAPHGFIELTVIFIAGGAGLRLGYALVHPGFQTRRESLTLAARQAVKVLFGCVPLLVIAGTIEGFVSPSALLPEVKLAVGAISGLLLYSYLLLAGRKVPHETGGLMS